MVTGGKGPVVESIYELLETGATVDEGLIKEFGESLSKALAERLNERPKEFTLRMSNIGKGDRQLWYDKRFYRQEKLRGPTLIKFMYGEIVESLVLFLASASGHKVSEQQAEVSVNGIKGHIDADIDGITVDVKSASTHGFRKFKDGSLATNDPFGYIEQISGYMTARGTEGAFIAADKVTGELAWFPVSKEDAAAIDVPARIDHLKQMLDNEVEPERCHPAVPEGESGNMVLGVNCSYCDHKFRCWADANRGMGLRTFLYSTGPKHFVHVAKEPRVKEISF